MFGITRLFHKAEDFFAEMGVGSIVGGAAALYVMGAQRNLETLAIFAAVSSVPHLMLTQGNILSAMAYETLSSVVPFAMMGVLGFFSIENALIFVGGAMIGGVAAGALTSSSLF